MIHPNIKDRNKAILWARNVLSQPHDHIILDTETTGLGKNDVIIQMAIIDLAGNELLNTLLKPTKRKRISSDAVAIHGITMKMLQSAPTFAEILRNFYDIIAGKRIVIYNAQYDVRLLLQTASQDEIKEDASLDCRCAMTFYSMFVGEWSRYYHNYKYQRLPYGDHSALGDCKATLRVIKEMAGADIIVPPRKWWQFWK